MSFCGNCGHMLETGAKSCPNCGAPVAGAFTSEAAQTVNEAAQNVNEAAGAAAAGAAAAGEAAQDSFQQQAQGSYSYQQTQGGYQQQGYQQTYQPAPKSVHPIAAGMWAYIFSWVGFIVCIAGADQSNPYVRFHTNQSLVYNLFSLIGILTPIPGLGLLAFAWGVFMFACQIIALIGASKGEMREMPLIGKIRILK